MKELICITCPRGCRLTVDDNMNVKGNFCPRGVTYAVNELTHPVRTLTTLVKTDGEITRVCPVRSTKPLPKDKIFNVIEEINKVSVKLPCKIGEIVIKNVCDTDVDIVIAKNIDL